MHRAYSYFQKIKNTLKIKAKMTIWKKNKKCEIEKSL